MSEFGEENSTRRGKEKAEEDHTDTSFWREWFRRVFRNEEDDARWPRLLQTVKESIRSSRTHDYRRELTKIMAINQRRNTNYPTLTNPLTGDDDVNTE